MEGIHRRGRPQCAGADQGADDVVRQAVGRARKGDRAALQYLYTRYVGDVRRYVQSILNDPHDAEDVAQNVFTKLLTSLDRYEERSAPFSAWLLRVARNSALDYMRQSRTVPRAEIYEIEPVRTDRAPHSASALTEALEELPDEQRLVLLMRHVVGLSPTEIAERLNRSEGSVHGLHHRGRSAMKAHLARLGAAPATAAGARG